MINSPSLSCIHWLEFVYKMLWHHFTMLWHHFAVTSFFCDLIFLWPHFGCILWHHHFWNDIRNDVSQLLCLTQLLYLIYICLVPFTATQAVVLDRPVSLQESELKTKDDKAYDDEGYLQPEHTYNQYEQMNSQGGEKDKGGCCNEQVMNFDSFLPFSIRVFGNKKNWKCWQCWHKRPFQVTLQKNYWSERGFNIRLTLFSVSLALQNLASRIFEN